MGIRLIALRVVRVGVVTQRGLMPVVIEPIRVIRVIRVVSRLSKGGKKIAIREVARAPGSTGWIKKIEAGVRFIALPHPDRERSSTDQNFS